MAFINMDAINFYQPNPLKAGPCGNKRQSARIRNIPIAGENYKRCHALGSISQTSESLQDYDPTEVLNMTTSQPDEPLDPYGKVGAAVNGGRLDVSVGLSDPIIPTRTEDFVYTANEHRINHGHSWIGGDTSQNLPSLDGLQFGATGRQEPQQAGESSVHSEMLDESLDRVVENGWREGDSPKPGWGESKEEPIRGADEHLESCDKLHIEGLGGNTQKTGQRQVDVQDTERDAASDSSVRTNDGLPLKEQYGEQNGGRNPLSSRSTSMTDSEAGSSILHRKNEISPLHITPLRCNSCLSSSAHTQIHESTADVRHDSEDDLSRSGDERASLDDKESKVGDEGGALQGIDNDMSALTRRTKKRRRSAAKKKLPLKRHVKRHRFSSPFSSDEGDETGSESDTSSYAPVEWYRGSNLASASVLPLSLGLEREPRSNRKHDSTDRMCRQHSPSRTAVVYEQQCWEGEILQERDVRQGRGRPRKQYLVRWKESWVDGACLASPDLLRNWREKKAL